MLEMIFILLAAQSTQASRPASPISRAIGAPPKVTCPPAAEETRRLLELSPSAFDQNPNSGWRPYAAAGCYVDAARLIEDYMKANPSAKLGLIRFHLFQMLAYAGDTSRALGVLEQVERDDIERNADAGWRMYVAGTRAFLENRRSDLEAQVTALVAFADQHGPSERAARLNANVLQGFVRCFGRPYAEAYGPPCADRATPRRIGTNMPPPAPPASRQ